jgi:hypothetical protein
MLEKQCLEGMGTELFAFSGFLEILAVTHLSTATHFSAVKSVSSVFGPSCLYLLANILLKKQDSLTDGKQSRKCQRQLK